MSRARIANAIGVATAITTLLGCRSSAPPAPAAPAVTVAAPRTQNVADFLDLSELQIAQTLRVRPGTVKSRLFEARRLLAGDEELAVAAGQG